MDDRDWTGTAAAVFALILTAGVWLWPSNETPRPVSQDRFAVLQGAEDMARWREEARRWDTGPQPDAIQLSATGNTAQTVR